MTKLEEYALLNLNQLTWAFFSEWQNYVFNNDVNNSAIGYWYLQNVYVNVLSLAYLGISEITLRFYLDLPNQLDGEGLCHYLPVPTSSTSYLTLLVMDYKNLDIK